MKSNFLVDPEVTAELPDKFGRLVLFYVLLQSGGRHGTLGEQLQQLRAQGPVGGLDCLSEPLIEQLPALLIEEIFNQLC